ncbi:MAG: bifunctional glutamine-synthetase adenylyltransferase/deadenyltransferase, partial [Propionibacteriaceae bacterium]|nr:bifunctional glutamine-synthetase adenylyltransferase/deadenyltransferase [Propionibacteriaceae bacterium]
MTATRAELARLGFLDPERGLAALGQMAAAGPRLAAAVLPLCAAAADPDLALETAAQLAEADPGLSHRLADPAAARRVIAVAGGSAALGRWLARRPCDLAVLEAEPARVNAAALRADLLQAVGADPAAWSSAASGPGACDPAAADNLRYAYRRQ